MTATTERPPFALPVSPEAIPTELTTRRQWVLWRHDMTQRGQWAKVPYRPDGRKARNNDARTWCDFGPALSAYLAGGYAGVGFVFAAEDPYVGVDLDACRDPLTGELSAHARRVIALLDGYAEVSPSATGVKLVIDAVRPEGLPCVFKDARQRKCVEVYQSVRYFALTGHRLSGCLARVPERQRELERLYRLNFFLPRQERRQPAPRRMPRTNARCDLMTRATRYVRRCRPAISGRDGHGTTLCVANAVCWGFGLGVEAGFALLWSEYNPACRPPWTAAELRHKCEDAVNKPCGKPYGWLL